VKPETADYLAKARRCLEGAEQIAASTPLHHIPPITVDDAKSAIYTAGRFIDCIGGLPP
jgi:hypothetical protein